jgi:trimethylamine--corrinoid protein Co-methyltransferase
MLAQDELEQLHGAALDILATTGLNVHHPDMRRQLVAAGASAEEERRVTIPRPMVEQALRSARRGLVIYDRLSRPTMPLDPHHSYFGTGSDLVKTYDVDTGERRSSRLEDVGQAARLCDALDEIDFVMSNALPGEVPNQEAEPRQYYAMLCNTVKPVIMTSFSGLETFERLHQMACAVAGGEQAFRQRPNLIMYGQFVSPLQHDRQAIERLIFCADHEIPLIYVATIMPGASGPITLAGSLALAAAESLAGLVMHQVRRPGAPFIFGACVSPLDMRTMLFPYGSPEWRLNDLVMAELARFYGLPVFGTGGATDSKRVDAQAGAECALSLLVAAMAGVNLIHDVGYLESGIAGSLESIVLGTEQIRWIKQFVAGVPVSNETFALEAIHEVGPGRQFLDHAHTLQHLRRVMWAPRLADRRNYETWSAGGGQDCAARARDDARQLVHAHQPLLLDAALDATLRELCHL